MMMEDRGLREKKGTDTPWAFASVSVCMDLIAVSFERVQSYA